VRALEFDLMNNDGSSSQGDGGAPVAVKNYNNGTVTSLTGVVDQELVACIVAMFGDAAFPKVPSSPNPAADNQSAIAAVTSMASPRFDSIPHGDSHAGERTHALSGSERGQQRQLRHDWA